MPQRLLSRDSLILAVGIWTIYALLEFSISESIDPLTLMWATTGLLMTLLLAVVLRPVLRIRPSAVRFATIAGLAVAFAVIQTAADLVIAFTIGQHIGVFPAPPGIELDPTNYALQTAAKLTFKFYIWLFGFYAAILALMSATQEKWRARVAAQRAEMDALRLQVNPHFLFNALTAMDGLLALRRTEDATRMLHSLSDFYRSTLLDRDDRMIPLEEEMAILEDYAAVEHVRFGDRLRLVVDGADAAAGVSVPPLLLQPVVENAIKYGDDGVSPFTVTVSVAVGEGRVSITVLNPLRQGGDRPGSGTGLANVRNRLALLYGDAASIQAGPDEEVWRVRIDLPLTA